MGVSKRNSVEPNKPTTRLRLEIAAQLSGLSDRARLRAIGFHHARSGQDSPVH